MCKRTSKKILSVTREEDDVIFLSDMRLNSVKQVSAGNDIKKRFAFRGYDMFINSTTNSRGVGIFISKKLPYEVHRECSDVQCNFIILDISIHGKRLTLGSVYGPNHDYELFFTNLSNDIHNIGNGCVILGGDWNSTVDGMYGNKNLDILNMAAVPSRRRSNWLKTLCNNHNLTDPYRFFYPDRREYTYIPNAVANTNRSRLDFYLMSADLVTICKNCTIGHHLDSLIFDHKSVRLTFRSMNPASKQIINDNILSDIDLASSVKCYTIDHYVNHATVDNDFPDDLRANIQHQLGQILDRLRRINEAKTNVALGITVGDNNQSINRYRTEIETFFEQLPRLDYF
jgi:exonuclease III